MICSRGTGTSVFAELPTGYGKTWTICGGFVIQHRRGLVNKLLVLVPSDALRQQMAPLKNGDEGLRAPLRAMGYEPKRIVAVDKTERALRYARSHDVFVATYQQAYTDPQFWDRFFADGRWMVAFDEAHHLTDNAWGNAGQRIDATFRLYLSATPMRTDRKSIVGLREETLQDGSRVAVPDVRVTTKEATEEGALRPPKAYVHHYFIDVKVPGEDVPRRITTEELRSEGIKSVSDFSQYEARMQMRYESKYLSRILLDAYSEWNAREKRQPGQHQVLVFAMTNAHARAVASQLAAMVPATEGFTVDWVGQARSKSENDSVMSAYLSGDLKCLVQVDKAGEGFDNVRCSVLLFLHMVGSEPKLLQQIGRGRRRNYAIPFNEDSFTCLASADTPIADLIRNEEADTRSVLPPEHEASAEREQLELPLMDIPPLQVVGTEHDRVDVVANGTVCDRTMADAGREFLTLSGVQPEVLASMSDHTLAVIGERLRAGRAAEPTPGAKEFATESGAVEFWQQKVKRAAGTLASNALKMQGGAFEKSFLGDRIRTVHAQWKRVSGQHHDAMTASEFEQKYEWLHRVNTAMKQSGEVPTWLQK